MHLDLVEVDAALNLRISHVPPLSAVQEAGKYRLSVGHLPRAQSRVSLPSHTRNRMADTISGVAEHEPTAIRARDRLG